MKLITTQQSLMAVSAGTNSTMTAYDWMSRGSSAVGATALFMGGVYQIMGHKSPNILASMVVLPTCMVVGTVGGYVVGAGMHFIGNNLGKAIKYTTGAIDYVFKPDA